MRRVRNHKSSNTNPLAMFAVGVEQIVSDHMAHPTTYDDQELRAIERSPKIRPLPLVFSPLLRNIYS